MFHVKHSSTSHPVMRTSTAHPTGIPEHISAQNSTGRRGRHGIVRGTEDSDATALAVYAEQVRTALPHSAHFSHWLAEPHRVRQRCAGDPKALCSTVNSAGPRTCAVHLRRTHLELPIWSAAAGSLPTWGPSATDRVFHVKHAPCPLGAGSTTVRLAEESLTSMVTHDSLDVSRETSRQRTLAFQLPPEHDPESFGPRVRNEKVETAVSSVHREFSSQRQLPRSPAICFLYDTECPKILESNR